MTGSNDLHRKENSVVYEIILPSSFHPHPLSSPAFLLTSSLNGIAVKKNANLFSPAAFLRHTDFVFGIFFVFFCKCTSHTRDDTKPQGSLPQIGLIFLFLFLFFFVEGVYHALIVWVNVLYDKYMCLNVCV